MNSEMLDFATEAPVAGKKKGKGRKKRPRSKAEAKAPKAKAKAGDDGLTEEQRYQRDYYLRHRKKRSKKHKQRWRDDEPYRLREIERQREKRAEERRKAAADRFTERVQEKREKAKPTRRPKLAEIDDERVYVYGTGSLAREVGREDATIRAWLAQDVLPGASVWIGRRAHFTAEFCRAVRDACKRLYEEDGRGNLDILARLVRHELREQGVSIVPEVDADRIAAEDIEVPESSDG